MDQGISQGGYKRYLTFTRMMLPATRGEERPCILGLEWHPKAREMRRDLRSVFAVAIKKQIRIFAEVEPLPVDFVWELWFKKKYHAEEVRCIKWNPQDPKVLAIGIVTEEGESVADLVEWNGESFKRKYRHQVCNSTKLSSISWDSGGTHFLVTVNPEGNTQGRIFIIRDQNGNDPAQIKVIHTTYTTPFSALYKPATDLMFSIEEGDLQFHVWSGSMEWKQVIRKFYLTKIPVENDKEDGFNRRRGPNMIQHFNNLISLDFSMEGTAVTGSSLGSICINEVGESSTSDKNKYIAAAFRWDYVQHYNSQGDILSVAIEPWKRDKKPPTLRLLSGGDDGVVILWCVSCDWKLSSRIPRDELFERNCYAPDWEDYKSDCVYEESIRSISTDDSQEALHEEVNEPPTVAVAAAEEEELPPARQELQKLQDVFRGLKLDVESLRVKSEEGQIEASKAATMALSASLKADAVAEMAKRIGESVITQGAILEKLVELS